MVNGKQEIVLNYQILQKLVCMVDPQATRYFQDVVILMRQKCGWYACTIYSTQEAFYGYIIIATNKTTSYVSSMCI